MERYRLQPDVAVYFVTYSVVERLPVFVAEAAYCIITDSLNYCHEQKCLRINACVIIPTHTHAIVFDKDFDPQDSRQSLADLRKFTGRSLSDFCSQHLPACFNEILHVASTVDRNRRFWQPGRHPEAIKREKFREQKLDYLHANPCRKDLVLAAEHWRFSSPAYYVSAGRAQGDVTISALDWS